MSGRDRLAQVEGMTGPAVDWKAAIDALPRKARTPTRIRMGRVTSYRHTVVPGKLEGCEIQRIWKTPRGRWQAYIWGWAVPVPLDARTVMPPLLGYPVYGPEAARAARSRGVRYSQYIRRRQAPLRASHWRKHLLREGEQRLVTHAKAVLAARPPVMGRIMLMPGLGLRIVRA